tara:strand:- start:1319 stop:2176 length:858 start_codon:yes stop_codon:yes gene_type:complete
MCFKLLEGSTVKTLSLLVTLFFTLTASALSTYYPAEFKTKMNDLRNDDLKHEIFKVLDMKHVGGKNEDILVNNCSQAKGRCYSQRVLGYTAARKILFGKLHLEQTERGNFYVKDVYCRVNYDDRIGVGPDRIPNHTELNCEHTWPQSKFSSRFPNEMQKSDIHHLYPTNSRANSVRGNYEFGEVFNEDSGLCDASEVGGEERNGGGHYFEPPSEHKGNVARALFYFSVRYRTDISERQEEVLRKWHAEDPVDSEEMERNDQIHYIQGNRNPFIDMPELVSKIDNF